MKKTQDESEVTTKKRDKKQELLLKELERCPIVQVACARANVGRSTYYEWIQKDKGFSHATQRAIEIGNAIFTDLAESKLMESIQKGNIAAIIFRLKNFNPRYSEKKRFNIEYPEMEVTEEEQEAINFALYNIGLAEIIRMNSRQRKALNKKIKESSRTETEEEEDEIVHQLPKLPIQEKVEPKKELFRKKRGMVNIAEALGLQKKEEE